MNNSTAYRRSPLGLFPNQPDPRLYDRVVEVLRTKHYSRRTEEPTGGGAARGVAGRSAYPTDGFAASLSFTPAPMRATWPKATSTVS